MTIINNPYAVLYEDYVKAKVSTELTITVSINSPSIFSLNQAFSSVVYLCSKYYTVMTQEELFEWRMIGVILREEKKQFDLLFDLPVSSAYGTLRHIPGCGGEMILEINVKERYIHMICPRCAGDSNLFKTAKKCFIYVKEINHADSGN